MMADDRSREERYVGIHTEYKMNEEEIEGINNASLKTYEHNQDIFEEQQDCFLYKSINVPSVKDLSSTVVSDLADTFDTAKGAYQGQIKINENNETSTDFKVNKNINDNALRLELPSPSIFSSDIARGIYYNWLKDRAKSLLVNYNKIKSKVSQNMPEIERSLDLHGSSDDKTFEEKPLNKCAYRMDERSEYLLHADYLESEIENNVKNPIIVRVHRTDKEGCNQSSTINSDEEIKDNKKQITSDDQKMSTNFETKNTKGTEKFTQELQEQNDHDFEQQFIRLIDKEHSNHSKKLFNEDVRKTIEKHLENGFFSKKDEINKNQEPTSTFDTLAYSHKNRIINTDSKQPEKEDTKNIYTEQSNNVTQEYQSALKECNEAHKSKKDEIKNEDSANTIHTEYPHNKHILNTDSEKPEIEGSKNIYEEQNNNISQDYQSGLKECNKAELTLNKDKNSDLRRNTVEISNKAIQPFAEFIKNEIFTSEAEEEPLSLQTAKSHISNTHLVLMQCPKCNTFINGINNDDVISNAKDERKSKNIIKYKPFSAENFEHLAVDNIVSNNILLGLSDKRLKTGALLTDIYKHLLKQKGLRNVKMLKQDTKIFLQYALESCIIKKNRNRYVLTKNGKQIAEIIHDNINKTKKMQIRTHIRNSTVTGGREVKVNNKSSDVKNRKSSKFMCKSKKSSTSKKIYDNEDKRDQGAKYKSNKFKYSKIKKKNSNNEVSSDPKKEVVRVLRSRNVLQFYEN